MNRLSLSDNIIINCIILLVYSIALNQLPDYSGIINYTLNSYILHKSPGGATLSCFGMFYYDTCAPPPPHLYML